jgi:hypothetical protein
MITPENPQATSNPDREAGGCCGPSPCSLDSVCKSARRKRLCWGLMNLSNWCVSRAESDACEATTMTMLERKTRELRSAVDQAGWDAVADYVSANNEDQT